jgi:uncharacterized protein YodC (DUF2158 family)
MSEQFRIGDTVRLRSGGPVMSIMAMKQSYAGATIIKCVWWDQRKYQGAIFRAELLQPCSAESETTRGQPDTLPEESTRGN